MNWIRLLEIVYIIIVILVILRVLYDTRSSTKALAYILFICFLPIVGIIFYFSFGINYRKRKLYSNKIVQDETLRKQIEEKLNNYSDTIKDTGLISEKRDTLIEYIRHAGNSRLTANNELKLLINGEEKFPELLNALENATSHIHIEYYIYENDITGNQVADILIKKAKQGVEVRFMYDDFGSHGLGSAFINKLKDAGVETAPFYEIKFYAFASRINYRNHRKIVIIDGTVSFIGGINMSDKYRNDIKGEHPLFWRDTHLMIKGQATTHLQYLFMCDWNFCCDTQLEYSETYFPDTTKQLNFKNEVVQIAASGPDCKQPVVFYSLLEAINSATKNIYITSPYFIPDESLLDALIIAIQGGLDVKIIIPGITDSKIVNTAASSYYTELLQFGAKIYRYNKGFIHAKTMVIDDDLAIVGSANMDYRSFDLNFEVNAVMYSKNITRQLTDVFMNDLKYSEKIDAEAWLARPTYIHLWEKIVKLLSPFL